MDDKFRVSSVDFIKSPLSFYTMVLIFSAAAFSMDVATVPKVYDFIYSGLFLCKTKEGNPLNNQMCLSTPLALPDKLSEQLKTKK